MMSESISHLEHYDRAHLRVVPDNQTLEPDQDVTVLADFYTTAVASAQLAREPRLISRKPVPEGERVTYGLIDEAGYARATDVYLPKHQTTDVPVIATTAWTTSNRGHNEHTARRFVREGSPVIIQGAEGSFRPGLFRTPVPNEEISLRLSAGALLTASQFAAAAHPDSIHPTERTLIGESRGGMVGMGVLALANEFGQTVAFADLTAPCFPRGLQLSDIQKFSEQFISEPKTFIKLAGKFALRQLLHYPSTVDPHPYAMAHQIGLGPALFSGEAGDLARLIDNDPIVHVTCFDDDFASMPDEWDEIFADNPNSRITLLEGSHLSIADPETLRYLLARNRAFYLLKMGLGGNKPSGDEVFEMAHDIISAEDKVSSQTLALIS